MGQNDKSTSGTFLWKEILSFLGVVLAAYIGYLGIRSQTELPIQATQAAEARLTIAAQTPTPQNFLLQSTQPPTSNNLVVLSDSLSDGCIHSESWYSLLSASTNGEGNCLSLESWGIVGKNDGISIAMNGSSEVIRQGIYAPIKNGTQISFKLVISTLYTPYENNLANLSIGVISINSHDLESNTLLIYQRESPKDGYPIFLKMKERDGYSAYLSLNGEYRKYAEFTEQLITLDLSATNTLTIYIDGSQVIQVNLPYQDKALWIGYRLPENGQINAEISNLQIQEK